MTKVTRVTGAGSRFVVPWALGIAAVATVLAVLTPRAMPVVLVAAVIGIFAQSKCRPIQCMLRRPDLLGGLIVTFLIWVLASAMWAPDPLHSLGKGILLTAFVMLVGAAIKALENAPYNNGWSAILDGIVYGMLVATVILAIELVSNQWLAMTITRLCSAVCPYFGVSVNAEGAVDLVAVKLVSMNRRVFLWIALLLSVALLFRSRFRSRYGNSHIALLAAASLVILISTENQSAQFFAVSGLAMFAIARLSFMWARRLLAIGFLTLAVLSVPAARLALDLGVNTWSNLPMSARHRIAIWSYTAEQIQRNPWRGIGFDGTAALELHDHRARIENQTKDPSRRFELGRHAHNIYLQILLELGVPGIGLFAGIFILSLRRLEALPDMQRALALAVAASFTTSLAVSYSLWQPWLMALIGFLLLFFRASIRWGSDGPLGRDTYS